MPDTNFTAAIYGLYNNNYVGSSNVTPPRSGMYYRSIAGYCYETLCDFDVSSLAGKTVESAYIEFDVTGSGSGTVSQTVYAMEQNKANPTGWSSPPVYNDFGNFPSDSYWDTEINNVTGVVFNNTYTILDSGDKLKDLIQSWIDDSADNWGFVLTRDDNATSRWIEIDEVRLYVTYANGEGDKVTFSTPGSDTWDVPAGVNSITAKVWAPGGGGGAGGTVGVGGDGGGGGYVKAKLSVTPLETLNIHVGGDGGLAVFGGTYSGGGGGGGGRSSIFRSTTPLLIAGAGGGGGGGDNSSATKGGNGGEGGGATGVSGDPSSDADGGGGGGPTSGGAGGTGGANVGVAGQDYDGSPAGGGGDGADGTTGSGKGGEANGGITNGGDGGEGDVTNGYAGGGGGASGRAGGGGGSCSAVGNAGGGGGGGGSNYLDGGATETQNLQASDQTPPNTGDEDYTGSVGVGGDGGATSSSGTNGFDGYIVIILPSETVADLLMPNVCRGVGNGVGRGVR